MAAGPVQINDNDFGVAGMDTGATMLQRGTAAEFLDRSAKLPVTEARTLAAERIVAADSIYTDRIVTDRALYQERYLTTLQGDIPSLPALPLLFDLFGAASVFVYDLVTRASVLSDEQDDAASATSRIGIWTNAFGNVAFNDNNVALFAGSFAANRDVRGVVASEFSARGSAGFNVALLSRDDVGSDSNRIACMSAQYMIANLFAAAATVRATANRLQEPRNLSSVLSALTVGETANATALNQADHCIADVILESAFETTGRPHVLGGASAPLTLMLNAQHVAAAGGEAKCENARKMGQDDFGSIAWLIWVIEILGTVYARYQVSNWSTEQTLTGLMKTFDAEAVLRKTNP
jgi:hypothetical protein